ncbi:lysophosphatidic acid receptor 4-like [Melanotaenia boesemani]|uniref:lysophosphatidic acid receptor 4-like n=1 Tax=Melanotaenia boesemani TaxID=1250792 RepID=UPI001C047F5A|nr:lysophosphatidic acid receptor 4-like [Melanotaenia boesemani]
MTELVYAGYFGCILVLGLSLNVVSLWILLRRHSLRSSNAVFMVNLAISDLLLVITLPFRVYLYATNRWPLGKNVCVFFTILFRNNFRSSSIFITFISVDRLLAVVYPLRSRHLRTISNAWKGVVFTWLFLVVLSIQESLEFHKKLQNTNQTDTNNTCFESAVKAGPKHPLVYFRAVLELVMLAVNIVCTVLVSWTLRGHLSDSARINNRMNVMVIFVLNLVMFIVCFLPLSLGVIIVKNSSDLRPLICIACVNCCLDPLLYYFSLDAFWKKKEEVDVSREPRTRETHL